MYILRTIYIVNLSFEQGVQAYLAPLLIFFSLLHWGVSPQTPREPAEKVTNDSWGRFRNLPHDFFSSLPASSIFLS